MNVAAWEQNTFLVTAGNDMMVFSIPFYAPKVTNHHSNMPVPWIPPFHYF